MVDGIVNNTGNAQHDDARRAYQQTGTGIIVAAESGDRLIARIDVHGFHHAQVIIEREHRVDQRNEHQQVETAVESRRKDEELREEARERRNAR